MAATYAVVRNVLTATLSGTTDFTSSGFGTPDAAILITCNGNSSANPATTGTLSIGFWDGTNQCCVAVLCIDAVVTTGTTRASNDSYGAIINPQSGANSGYTVSSITDGIRLTMSTDNTSLQRFCTVLLIKGVSAKVTNLQTSGSVNGTIESASLGFAPSLVFVSSIFLTAVDNTASSDAMLSFGFAKSDGTHRCLAFSSDSAVADETANILYSETRCVTKAFQDSAGWTGEITTFGADTFTITTRDSTGGDYIFALALGGADLSFDCGTLTTPTSTGNSAVSTDIAPDAVLLALSTATGTTIETGSGANGLMFGLADDNGQFCHNLSVEDGAATTNCNSAAQAAAVLDLDSSSGGSRTEMCDATSTLNSSDFTLNYSATDGTARKGWWVAFGPAAAGGNFLGKGILEGSKISRGSLVA